MAGFENGVDTMVSQNSGNDVKLLSSADQKTHSIGTGPPPSTGCDDISFHETNGTHGAEREDCYLAEEVIGSGSEKLNEHASDNSSIKNDWSSSLIQNFQGYKAVIMFASFFFSMVSTGIGLSVGVYFIALQEEFETGASLTALTSSLYVGIRSFTAPLSSLLVDRFGIRVVVMTGGLIATVGCLATVFANSFFFVLFTFAIITPLGAGLAYVPAMTIPAAYYDQRGRAFAFSFASAGAGIGQFVMSNVLAATIEAYTWRGSMFISAGVILQIVVLGALMRTPKTWKKTQPKQTDERSSYRNQILRIYKNVELVMFFLHYILISCGLSVIYGYITAVTETLPNVSKQQAALPLSMIGLSMIIGRTASGVIGQLKCVNVFLFYCLATLVSGFVIMLVPVVAGYTFTVICTFVFGLLLAPYGCLYNIVMLYFCDLSDLMAAFAHMSLLSGLGFVSGAPLAGLLYEVTGYYDSSIYLGGALIVASSLVLVWPYMSHRRRHAKEMAIIGDQVKALSVGSMGMIGSQCMTYGLQEVLRSEISVDKL
ncbi:monocarboxylate transporter 14-like [Lineus longissimus]|uniref:monocarboxylate transporter 14-like n=1 Tax=Lineus longissimus TaxID=88925 RepID=UPI002B4CE9DB